MLYSTSNTATRGLSWAMGVQDIPRVLMFMLGLCSGAMFSLVFFSAVRRSGVERPLHFEQNNSLDSSEIYLHGPDLHRVTHSMTETFHLGEDVIANELRESVRVLCVVKTTKDTYKTSGEAVRNTWGGHCNTLIFVSNFEDSELPVIKLDMEQDRFQYWGLMKRAIKYAYIHLLDTHDWFVRADDTTFMVVENLRHHLSGYDPTEALYLGCRFKREDPQGFMSAGAGYVLSREAVVRVATVGLPLETCHIADDGTEDVEMGHCMRSLNVTFLDTRDSLGRGRFFPLTPESHLIPDAIPKDHWYWDIMYYPPNQGYNCCSDTAISFNGISHQMMYTLNYLIYHLRPWGISSHPAFNLTEVQLLIN